MTLRGPSTTARVSTAAFLRDRRSGPRLLAVALLLALLFHGTLLAFGSYRNTFDAYVHIFFADHYARSWFNNWEPRWYTGFTVTSYPPGSHELIALFSFAVGLSWAFVIVQTLAILLLVVGVYRFSRLWVDPAAAGLAAIIAALSPAIGEAVHVYGQLPTIISLAFLLNALPFLQSWLLTGRLVPLVAALTGFAATTGCHHVTTLFGSVFFAGPVVIATMVRLLRHPAPGEDRSATAPVTRTTLLPLVLRRIRRITPFLVRLAVAGAGIAIALVLVDLAYWLWSSSDPITQIPIPHASRDSYLANPNAGLLFFVIPWGVWLVVLPYAVVQGIRGRTWPLLLSLLVLALFGTGGTTPLPKLILRGAYEILTLDRFGFWATIAVLPFAALFLRSLLAGGIAGVLEGQLGKPARAALQGAFLVLVVASTVLSVTVTVFRPTEPPAVDPKPVAEFLAKDQHWRYRYLTLGLGDQMAWLSAQTEATTVDGNYHSARRLPELTSTPVERLDGAKYTGVPGLGSLQRFLGMPERYSLKFVFSADRFYEPLLYFSGWRQIGTLENGLAIWQHDDIPPLPATLPAKVIPLWQRLLWGLLPPLAIGSALATSLLAVVLARRGRRGPVLRRLGGDRAVRPWRPVDRFLARHSRVPAGVRVERRDWHLWAARLRLRLPAPAAPRVRTRRSLLLVLAVCVVAAAGVIATRRPLGPEATIRAYYHALDLHDLDGAYAMLDPETRPSLEQYHLAMSVRGGLLGDAYAKLGALDVTLVSQTADRAESLATAHWVTALSWYQSEDPVSLVLRRGVWTIDPGQWPVAIQGDEVVSVPGVDWNQRGRRAVTDSVTPYADVLDRPQLEVVDARPVTMDGRIAVVGLVRNTATIPADLTIDGTLRDAAGKSLADAAVSTVMAHTLQPGESTPFRLDFEGIPGADTRDLASVAFTPDAYTPLDPSVLAQVASIDLGVRAVVTALAVHTAPTLAGVTVTRNGDACQVSATVGSPGVASLSIPRLLVSSYDASGRLAWVASRLLPYGVRAGGLADTVVPVDPPAQPLSVTVNLEVNGLPATTSPSMPGTAIAAPAGCGPARVDVRADAYEAGP